MSYQISTDAERARREKLANCIGPNTHLCAGEPLQSLDLYKTLMEVMSCSFRPDLVPDLILPEIVLLGRCNDVPKDLIEKSFSAFKNASRTAMDDLSFYRDVPDQKYLEDTFTNYSEAAGELLLCLSPFQKINDDEDRKTILINSIETKFDSLIPSYKAPCSTNIAAVLHILTPRTDEYLKKVYHKEFKEGEYHTFKSRNGYSQMDRAFMLPMREEISYTLFSPYLLRSLFNYVNNVVDSFFDSLHPELSNRESFLEFLGNNTEDSSCPFFLEIEKQNVTMTRKIPNWFLNSALEEKNKLKEKLGSVQELIGAISPKSLAERISSPESTQELIGTTSSNQDHIKVDINDGELSLCIKLPKGIPMEYEQIEEEDKENIRTFLSNCDIPLLTTWRY